jgi:predicted site-specific integrase-resolvase
VVSWCHECGQRIEMIPVEAAATIAGVSTRTIYRWIEAHELHFLERADGVLLICPSSLPRASSKAELRIYDQGEKV